MIRGVITTKEILTHPVTMIASIGFVAYALLVLKGLEGRTYHFIDLMYEIHGR